MYYVLERNWRGVEGEQKKSVVLVDRNSISVCRLGENLKSYFFLFLLTKLSDGISNKNVS